MKKIFKLLFMLILSLSIVKAETIDFKIIDAKIDEKYGAVDAIDPVFSSDEVSSNITFKQVGDYVIYSFKLENNSEKSYKLTNVTDNNSSNKISTTYEYSKEEVAPNETVSLKMKIQYNEVVKNVDSIDLDEFNVILTLEDENGNSSEININPKTGDNILFYIVVLMLSCVGLVLTIKKIKGGKVLLVAPLIIAPLLIFGLQQFKINITIKNIEIEGTFDVFNIVVDSNNGDTENRTITYGDTVGSLPTPSKEGYTFAGWYDSLGNAVDENTTITSETSIEARYNAIHYNITYDLDGGNATNVDSYTIEDEITLNNPTKEGYTFAGWTEGNETTLRTSLTIEKGTTGDKSFTAHYSESPDTKYTVIHKKQNMEGVYVEAETETLHGVTGSEVTPQPKNYTGFKKPAEQTVTIDANGSTTVTYEYERLKYTFTVNNREYVETTTADGEYYYETNITLTAKEREGYTFSKWSNNETSNPLTITLEENTTIELIYTPNTNTPYKVKHMTMTVDGSGYELYSEVNATGTTDENVTAPLLTITGFDTPEAQTKTIKADGSTVFTYEYARQQRTLTIDSSEYVETTTPSGSYYYDTNVTVTAKEKPGYTFSKWSNDNTSNPYTFNLTENTTIEPIYTANTNTPYKVLHKTMTVDGSDYELYQEVNATGTTDSNVTVEVLTITGFDSPTPQVATIKGDGSTVVTYEYVRQQRALTINNSEYVETTTPSGNYYYGTSITLKAKDKTGYTFSKWSNGNTNNPYTFALTENTTIGPEYAAGDGIAYKVLHKTMTVDGSDYELYSEVNATGVADENVTPAVLTITGFDSPNPQTAKVNPDGSTVVTYLYDRQQRTLTINNSDYVETTTPSGDYYYETNITVTAKEKTGYTFSKWSDNNTSNPYTFSLEENITIEPIYTANTNTPYKVLHKTMTVDGSSYELYQEVNATGTTDENVTPEVLTITGFDSPSTQTVKVNGDGSTVVTYEYTRQQRTLTINNSEYVNTTTPSGEYYYDTNVTVTAKDRDGYTFSKWSDNNTSNPYTFSLKENKTIEPIYTANTNTPYKVLHKTMTVDGSSYELYQEVNATGTTDENVTPEVLTITGFDSPSTQTVKVNGDGSTVVTYEYTRQQRALTINNSEYVETTTPSGDYYYGTSITLKAKTRAGYTFSKWSNNNTNGTYTFALTENTTIEPIYTANTNTPYTVNHMTMNVSGSGYSLYSGLNNTGTTDANITVPVLTIPGFDSPEAQTVTIKGDGSTVVTYEYIRQKRTLTIGSSEYVETTTPSGEYYYETNITLSAKERPGYTFVQWSNNISTNPYTFALTANTAIEPIYSQNHYTVTFNSMGGSSVPSITDKTYNEPIGTLPVPVKGDSYFAGWYTEDGNTKITSSTPVTDNVTYYAHWIDVVCKKATVLHTETCYHDSTSSNGDTGCKNAGIAQNATLTYGSIPDQYNTVAGAAYDCDVNNDGTFDSATERFYFIRKTDDDKAVLVHFTNFDEDGQTDNSTERKIYPYEDGKAYLPDSTVWTNPVLAEFNGKVSRYLTQADIIAACGPWNTNNGYLDACTYLLENSRYQSNTLGRSAIWIEKIGNTISRIDTKSRKIATGENSGVRPVIEIPIKALEGYAQTAKYTVTFDSQGGSSVASIERYENETVGTLPTTIWDEHTFKGWFTDNTNYNTQVTADTIVTGNVTYYAKWEEIVNDPLETVFYIPGSCTFNGHITLSNVGTITSNSEQGCVSTINPSGNDIDYTNVKYIDSKIALFSESNYERDFELGFTIDEFLSFDNNVNNQATLVTAKVDNVSENYPGIAIRRNNSKFELTGRFLAGTQPTFTKNLTSTDGTQIKIARMSGKLYYAENDGDWIELYDTSNYDKRFNITTWFGAYSDETNMTATGEDSNADRYFKGTLSNIYIKLDTSLDTNQTVTFDAHEGTASFTSKEVPKGQAIGTLPTANRTGYHFDGWYTEPSDGRKIDETETISNDVTFHAQYKKIHTVTFDAGNGTLSISPNTVEVIDGQTLTSLPSADLTNKIFDGWYNANDVKIDGTEIINSDVTYHAVYLDIHTVTFDTNGATPATITQKVGHGRAVGPLPTVTLADHTLDGWYTDSTFSTQVTESTIINGDVTFIAKWSEDNTVAMIGDQGYSSLQAAVAAVPTTGVKTTIRIIKDIVVTESTTIPNTKWVELDIGSHTVSTESGTYTLLVNNGKLDIINGTLTSSAGYILENKNNATLNISGGSLVYDKSGETEHKVLEMSGGIVNITGGELSCNSKAAVINANGGTLNVSGGRIIGSNTFKGQAIYNNGATTNISGTAYLENNSQSGTQNGRAALTNNSGTVNITGGTFISKNNAAIKNSGTMTIGVESNPIDTTNIVLQGYNYGLEIASGKTVTVYGGIFKGRDTSNTNNKAINNESLVTHSGTTTIVHTRETIDSVEYDVAYLEASAPQQINISLNANGGSVSPDTVQVNSGSPVGTLPTPTKGVYTFDGWYQDENLTTPVEENVTIPASNTTYFAKWSYNASNEIVNFNMTNEVMSNYYSNISTWKNNTSTFQTNMDNNFNNYNCSACTGPSYQDCPTPAAGTTLCDQPLGYDTGMNASVKVYNSSEANKEKGSLVSYTTSDSGVIYNMIPGEVYYWELESDENVHGLVKASGNRRNIYSSVRNVRDLGGMSASYTDDEGTHSGTLKYGILFRGSKLNSSSDATELAKLGINEELDVREPNSDSTRVGTYKNYEILNYIFDRSTAEKAAFRNAITVAMQDVVDNKNIYFHCKIGTDRTGTLAYFLEGLLGVPQEEKLQDYELSYFYGLLNRHRFHDNLASSSINPRFATMASTYDTNEKIYNWYIDDPDNQAADILLVKQFRDKMINYN